MISWGQCTEGPSNCDGGEHSVELLIGFEQRSNMIMLMIQCQRLVAVRSALILLPSSFRMRVSHGTDIFGRGKKKKKKWCPNNTYWHCSVLYFFKIYFVSVLYYWSIFFFKGKTQGIGRTRTFVHILHIELKVRSARRLLQVIRLRSTECSLVTVQPVTREETQIWKGMWEASL